MTDFFLQNKGKPWKDLELGDDDGICKLKNLAMNSKEGLEVHQSR